MAFDLGQARGEIVIDASGATRGVRQAQGALNGLSQSTQTVGFGLSALGGTLIGIGGAATLGIGAAVREAMGFEEALANVATISERVADNTELFGQTILDVASKTNRAASDLADAFYQIVSAAIEGDQGLFVLEAAAQAANAGLTDTATAANILTATLNSGITGLDLTTFTLQDLANVNDILFQTVNRGVFTYEQLAKALGDSLPLASGLGVNLTELGAAFAIITRNGQTASEASTQINAVFSALLKPSTALQAILSGLGYESGQAAIDALGFAGALEAIDAAIQSSGAEVDDFSGNIRAVRGYLGLTNSAAGDFATEVSQIGEATGATNNALEQQQKTLSFAVTSLRNALERLAISVGTTLVPILTRAANFLTTVVNKFEKIPAPIKTAIVAIAGIGGIIAVTLGVIAIFASQLIAIAAAFSLIKRNGLGLRGVLGGLLRPVQALGDGVTGLTAASNGAAGSTRRFGGSLSRISRPATAASDKVKQMAADVRALEKALPATTPRITALSTAMTGLQKSLKSVPSGFIKLRDSLTDMPRLLAPIPAALTPLVGPMTALSDPVKNVGSGFRGMRKGAEGLAPLLTSIETPLANLKPIMMGLGDDVKNIGNGFRGMGAGAKDLAPALTSIHTPLSNLKPIFTDLAKPVRSVGSGFNAMKRAATDLPTLLPQITAPLQALKPIMDSLSDPVKQVGLGFSKLRTAAADLPVNLPKIVKPLQDLAGPLSALSASSKEVGSGFSKIGSGIRSIAKADIADITSKIDDLGIGLKTFATNIGTAPKAFTQIGSGIRGMAKGLPDIAANLPLVSKAFADLDGPLSNVAISLADTPTKISALSRSFTSLAASLPNIPTPLAETATALGSMAANIGTSGDELAKIATSFKSMNSTVATSATNLPTISAALGGIATSATQAASPLASVATELKNISSAIASSPKKLASLATAISTIATNAGSASIGLGEVSKILGIMSTSLGSVNPLVATFSGFISTIASNATKLQNSLGPVAGQIEYLSLALSSYTGGFTALADDVLELGASVDLMGKSLTGKKALIDGFARSLSNLAGTAASFTLGGIATAIDDLAITLNASDGIFDNLVAGIDGLDQKFISLAGGMGQLSAQLPKIAGALPSVAAGMVQLSDAIRVINPSKLKYIAEGVNDLGKLAPDTASKLASVSTSLKSLSASVGSAAFDRLATISKGLRAIGVESTAANAKIVTISKSIGSLQTKLPTLATSFGNLGTKLGSTRAALDGFSSSLSSIARNIPKINKDFAVALKDIDNALPKSNAKLLSTADGLSKLGSSLAPSNFSALKTLPIELRTATTSLAAYSTETIVAGKATTSFHTRLTTLITKMVALVPAINAATAAQIEFCIAAQCDTGVRNFGGLSEVIDDAGGSARRGTRAVAGLSDEVATLGIQAVAFDQFNRGPAFSPLRQGYIQRWDAAGVAIDDAAAAAARAEGRFIDLNGRIAAAPTPANYGGRFAKLLDKFSRPVGIVARATPATGIAAATGPKQISGIKKWSQETAKANKREIGFIKSLAKSSIGLGGFGKTISGVGAASKSAASQSARLGNYLIGPWKIFGKVAAKTASATLKAGSAIGFFGLRAAKTVLPIKLIGRWLNIWRIGFKVLISPIKAVILLLRGLTAALFFLASPFGIILAALGFFVAAFLGNWFGLRDKFSSLIDGIVARFKAFVTIFKEVKRISNIFSEAGDAASAARGEIQRELGVKWLAEGIGKQFGLTTEATDRLRSALGGLQANIAGLRISARKAEIGLSAIFSIIANGALGTANVTTALRFLGDAFGGNAADAIISGAYELRRALFGADEGVNDTFSNSALGRLKRWFAIENLFTNLAKAGRSFARFIRFRLFPVVGQLIAIALKTAAVLVRAVNLIRKGDWEGAFREIGNGIKRGIIGIYNSIETGSLGNIGEAIKSVAAAALGTAIDIGIAILSFTPELAKGIWGAAGDLYSWLKSKLFGTGGAVGDNTGVSQTQFIQPISFGTVLLAGTAALFGVIKSIASDFNKWLMTQIFGEDYSENQELPQNIGSVVLDGAIAIGSTIADWLGAGISSVAAWFSPLYDLVTVDLGDIEVDGSILPKEGIATDSGFGLSFLGSIIDSLWTALDEGQVIADGLEWANGVLDKINEWLFNVDFDEGVLFGFGTKVGDAINAALTGDSFTISGPDISFSQMSGQLVGQGVRTEEKTIGQKITDELVKLLLNVIENRAAIAAIAAKLTAAMGAFLGGVIAGAITGASINFDEEDLGDFKWRLYRIWQNTLVSIALDVLNTLDIERALTDLGLNKWVAKALTASLFGPGQLLIGSIPIEEAQAELNVQNWVFRTTPGAITADGDNELAIWTAILDGLESGNLVIGSDGRIYTQADFAVAAEANGIVDVTWQVTTPGGEVDALQQAIANGQIDGLGDWEAYDWGIDPSSPVPVTITVEPIGKVASTATTQNAKLIGQSIGDSAAASTDTSTANIGFAKFAANIGNKLSSGISGRDNKNKTQAAAGSLASIASSFAASRSGLFVNAGRQLGNGLAIGLTSSTGAVVAAAQGLANAANNAFSGSMRIQSPSKVWSDFGSYMGEGLAIGMGSSTDTVIRASDLLASMATPTTVPYESLKNSSSYGTAQAGPVFNNAVIYMPNAQTAEAVASYFMSYSRSRR